MKILMILFTRRHEGTFYRAMPWALFLTSRGHRVTLLCTSKEHLVRSTVSMDQGVRIIETPALFSGRNVMARLCGMYGWGPLDIIARVKELRRGSYDVVHTFEHHPNVTLPVCFAGPKPAPVLVSDWCDHYGQGGLGGEKYCPYRLRRIYKPIGWPFRILTEWMETALRDRADAVTVISIWLRQRAISKDIPAEKIHLITGSAETALIRPNSTRRARRKLGLNETLRYVLFFGNGQFDVGFSLKAFAHVLEKMPEARFIIAGKKDASLTKKSAELGMQDRVIQTGWITEDQLNDWLACADLCLLPMQDHPVNQARWPNKIGFYMAAGRPTVATEIGDVGTLIKERGIGLVSRVDQRDFAEKILHLLQHHDTAEAMGLRARKLAETEFSPSIQGEEIERLYMNLPGAHHG